MTQVDLFQGKHTGPHTVPETSKLAFKEVIITKRTKEDLALILVSKFPDKTAYELFHRTDRFKDVYQLRRSLSRLKKEFKLENPEERKCKVMERKMFTWRNAV